MKVIKRNQKSIYFNVKLKLDEHSKSRLNQSTILIIHYFLEWGIMKTFNGQVNEAQESSTKRIIWHTYDVIDFQKCHKLIL